MHPKRMPLSADPVFHLGHQEESHDTACLPVEPDAECKEIHNRKDWHRSLKQGGTVKEKLVRLAILIDGIIIGLVIGLVLPSEQREKLSRQVVEVMTALLEYMPDG